MITERKLIVLFSLVDISLNILIYVPSSGWYSTIDVAKNSLSNVEGNGFFSNCIQCYISSGISITGFTLKISVAATIATTGTLKVYGYK